MRITNNFTKTELERSNTATRLGLPNICPAELVPNMVRVATRLELVRAFFKKPVRVLSCYRSAVVNAAVGGSQTSAHKTANAADFTVDTFGMLEVAKWCADNITDYDQIILEFPDKDNPLAGWVHIGFTDGKPRKQLLTANKVNSKTVYTTGLTA